VLTRRPEHLRAFDYLGCHQYFLTFCTDRRRRIFTTAETVLTVRTQIERAAHEQSVALLTYCYMPDHVHFLAEGQADDSDCLRFIARAKQFSGFHYKATFGERLWQRFGFEHTLRSEEAAVSVARYILENR
jgi:REP element-mobilizing transposase RayT